MALFAFRAEFVEKQNSEALNSARDAPGYTGAMESYQGMVKMNRGFFKFDRDRAAAAWSLLDWAQGSQCNGLRDTSAGSGEENARNRRTQLNWADVDKSSLGLVELREQEILERAKDPYLSAFDICMTEVDAAERALNIAAFGPC